MLQDHLITVRPVPGGWRVALDDLQPQLFLSGRRAEGQARALAARLAGIGDRAELTIHDRASVLVGSQRF